MAFVDWLRRVLDRILLIERDAVPHEDAELHAEEPDGEDEEAEQAVGQTSPEDTGQIHVMRRTRADCAGMPVVLARPRNMDDATAVAERVKDRVPIIMNLEGVDESVSRRVVDFVGGVVFALDGSLRKGGRSVYICSPVDIPVEDLRPEQARPRTSLFDLDVEEVRQAAL